MSVMSTIPPTAEDYITIYDGKLEVYDRYSASKSVYTWKIPGFESNSLVVKCYWQRCIGGGYIASFDFSLDGPLIQAAKIKLTKQDAKPLDGSKHGELIQRDLNIFAGKPTSIQPVDCIFTDEYHDPHGKRVILVFVWLKIEMWFPALANSRLLPSLYVSSETLFNIPEYGDFKVYVGDQSFVVSKFALATNSPIFRDMFSSGMKEATTGSVQIRDFSAQVVEKMLRYMYDYTTVLDDAAPVLEELLHIADKYQVEGLKKRCAASLKKHITSENVDDYLVLAKQHKCEDLRRLCHLFIKANRTV